MSKLLETSSNWTTDLIGIYELIISSQKCIGGEGDEIRGIVSSDSSNIAKKINVTDIRRQTANTVAVPSPVSSKMFRHIHALTLHLINWRDEIFS